MPKKSQPGGSTEESPSTKPRKRTTKSRSKPVLDEAYYKAQSLWMEKMQGVYEDTILKKDTSFTPRASNPRSPEDKGWWDAKGPEMVADWIRFREFSGWKVWITPDLEPAVELELQVEVGDTFIKMAIDRIMVNPAGELCIVDLKTGRRNPQSTLQLGFYKYGMKKVYGVDINLGYYWMARSAAMSDPVDLTDYTEEKIEYLVTAFDAARKAHSFIPNTSSCNMCGYTVHCIWYQGGK